jgi:hypothetical protein
MNDIDIPDGFLRFSDAVNRFAQGIWGGLRRPAPLRSITPKNRRKVSLGFGPWVQEAGKRLRAAASEGKVVVYIFVGAQTSESNLDPNPVVLPTVVLSRLIPARESLPDRAIRPSLRIAGGDTKLFRLLQFGVLLVRAKEFSDWYRSERAKGRWPSQRSRRKRTEGRPSKQTESLRNAIKSDMREEKTSIAAARRRLVAMGRSDLPSEDTLARLVDQFYMETGEPEFRRTKRSRRQQT